VSPPLRTLSRRFVADRREGGDGMTAIVTEEWKL
jgi:hypothetical protein